MVKPARTTDELPRNVLAAATAGFIQPLLFNPLDALRIRFQVAGNRSSKSITAFAGDIIMKEGMVRGLYFTGLQWNCLAVSLSQGIRMGLYPSVRDTMVSADTAVRPDLMAIAGLLSGCIGYLVATPLFLLKVRTQASAQTRKWAPSPSTVGGYWLGGTPMVARGALLTAGQMAGYDGSKRIGRQLGLRDGQSLVACSACTAGLCAATLSAPADAITTHMQSRAGDGASMYASAAQIVRERGAIGLFRGWGVSLARLVPTFVVGTTIYEQARRSLGLKHMR